MEIGIEMEARGTGEQDSLLRTEDFLEGEVCRICPASIHTSFVSSPKQLKMESKVLILSHKLHKVRV